MQRSAIITHQAIGAVMQENRPRLAEVKAAARARGACCLKAKSGGDTGRGDRYAESSAEMA